MAIEHPPAPRVLIVDDETRILAALRRTLRREGWSILTADSADAARKIIAEEPLDLVLSDQQMPGMTGIELLGWVARERPEIVRLLITGWADAVSERELRESGVLQVILKPWDDGDLKQILRAALEYGGARRASA